MGYGGDNLDGYMDMSTQRMPPSTDLSRGDFGNFSNIFEQIHLKDFLALLFIFSRK